MHTYAHTHTHMRAHAQHTRTHTHTPRHTPTHPPLASPPLLSLGRVGLELVSSSPFGPSPSLSFGLCIYEGDKLGGALHGI